MTQPGPVDYMLNAYDTTGKRTRKYREAQRVDSVYSNTCLGSYSTSCRSRLHYWSPPMDDFL
jgi:hypothetical protein